MTLRVFGLTGGIGSGKSTVAARFRERGLPVVDADELSREAVARGSATLCAIVESFGPSMLDAHGELDRRRLSERVFADPEARRRLNALVHPRVRELSAQRFAGLAARGEPLACYEVPLLFEVGLDAALRPVVVVVTSEELQLERASARDGVPKEQIAARIAAQLPLSEKRRRADYVIENEGSPAEARARADDVLDAIGASLGVPTSRYPR